MASTAGSSFICRIADTTSACVASSGRCRCGLVNPSERARSIFMFT
jgi:hypothetical protein